MCLIACRTRVIIRKPSSAFIFVNFCLLKDTLAERIRVFKMRRDCESALRGKREQKVRIEMSPKADRAKIPTLEREIGEVSDGGLYVSLVSTSFQLH